MRVYDCLQMGILSVRSLNTAVSNYINKGDTDAISFVVKKQLGRRQGNKLINTRPDIILV